MTMKNDWMRGLSAALAIGLAGACGGDDGGEPAGGNGSGSGGAAGGGAGMGSAGSAGSAGSGEPTATGPAYGPFIVELIAATAVGVIAKPRPARTDITGFIRDGVKPDTEGWETIEEVGDCALLAPDPPSCVPACRAGYESCAFGDTCVPIPNKLSVGQVTVSGLGEPIALEDEVAGNYTLPNGLTRPYPPCAEGEPIMLAAEGVGQDPFTLQVPCVATLEAPEPVALAEGTPIELRWSAPAMPELTELHVHLNIAHHGGIDTKIECATDDDGELDIDAALVDGLIDIGIAGFPTIVLTRSVSMKGSDEASENLTLTASSTYESPVMIPGVVSCTADAECPDGQTCGSDLRCL
jgi:hypothetical protein